MLPSKTVEVNPDLSPSSGLKGDRQSVLSPWLPIRVLVQNQMKSLVLRKYPKASGLTQLLGCGWA